MSVLGSVVRALAVVGLGVAVAFGGALTTGGADAANAATYPPATTGTFAVTAHPGANTITVNGLGPSKPATAIISGTGPAPTLGAFDAAARSATVNLAVGETDASGSVTFTLVFPAKASGVYNASVSTPDGHSVSGVITVPGQNGSVLAWTGTNIALWIVWLAGALIIAGLIALIVSTARRRSGR
ncbi:MAG: hypothetical protein FWD85_03945 [Microbacteriaceae bacterium]|nr:hypothetical protein [Microbacteriaceae bacterium]MCL2794441.1 hypothetical protein [Microbacteriaceae bacterium]